ncbi:uncharacterized protein BXZ73DRAFT_103014 [Epithele typhae]|uniref:uncharacterized protein n=1 Tax=Epithele typhae TaxID=378194 RepID=UPI002008C0E3|nr:uncharacterized protein BXZ73DRAFT_103014 [Epithele typhae]KAH9926333.1 hypothetical protein BXZ73DRAFT_103014 [Epithele typhae]
MSLDQNLFTLNVSPRQDDRSIVDLVDAKGVVHYTKRRLPTNEYRIEVYGFDRVCYCPSPTNKHKTVQLYNPDIVVELKFSGMISFKWSFKWEDNEFEWRREECYIIRKPDPAVLVAVTKEPPGKLQTRAVQILDYNLNRFDIDDRKGLEIVILTALLTFQDSNETYHTPKDGTPSVQTPSQPVTPSGPPPLVPPRPEPRQGVDRVAELHALRTAQGDGDANEVHVSEECSIEDYARYAEQLLNDGAMLLVSVRSASAAEVPKVLRVVEETKRLRHKSGIAEDVELHQYVIYETEQSRKGPRRINLNDPDPKRDQYAPPTSLTIHLSKIDMPELRPRVTVHRPSGSIELPSPPPPEVQLSDKERKKLEREREKERKKTEKDGKKKPKSKAQEDPALRLSTSPSPPQGHASAPVSRAHSPSRPPKGKLAKSSHTPAHQVHVYQPSPSPSQLGNPMIYAAPPPPHTSQASRPRPGSMAYPAPNHVQSPISPTTQQGPAFGNWGSMDRQSSGRPTSFFQPAGKGPVTSLLSMWSKQ